MQPMLGLGGDLDDRGLELLLSLLQGAASPWPMSVAPCRLEEDPAHLGVAALGDGVLGATTWHATLSSTSCQ
jgi:hypothetical protein